MKVQRWNVVIFSMAAGAILVVVGLLSFIAGEMSATFEGRIERIDEEREWVSARLKGKPEFANVKIGPRSLGGVVVYGEVASQDELGRLRSEVFQAIGEHRTNESFHVKVNSHHHLTE